MATGALMAAGFAADAKAVDVELYGQVNKTLIAADNGNATEVVIRDNDKSSTRVGLKGEQALDNGLTASVLVEYEMNGDDSQRDNLFATNTGTSSTLTERHARVGLSGHFGTVMLGHTSVATDGTMEQDIAGTSDLLGSDIARFGGVSSFVGTNAAAIASGQTVGSVFKTYDGTRADVVAYHTPIVSGLQGRISTSEGGSIQTGLFYKGRYDEFAVRAAVGYELNEDRQSTPSPVASAIDTVVTGSVSVKHDSGIGATYAYGSESRDQGAESDAHYFKVGYTFDAFEVAADYSFHNLDNASDTEGQAFGIGAQYNLGHGVSVSGAYRTMEVEDNTRDFDEIDLFLANVRVKF